MRWCISGVGGLRLVLVVRSPGMEALFWIGVGCEWVEWVGGGRVSMGVLRLMGCHGGKVMGLRSG